MNLFAAVLRYELLLMFIAIPITTVLYWRDKNLRNVSIIV